MKKNLSLLVFFLFFTALAYSQTDTTVYYYNSTENSSVRPDSLLLKTMVDVNPEFPGGDKGMALYMTKTVKYPQEAKEKGVQGAILVSFIVEADGKVSSVSVQKGVENGHGLNEEAMRVIRSMPDWKPGIKNGKAVRTKMVRPVRFALE